MIPPPSLTLIPLSHRFLPGALALLFTLHTNPGTAQVVRGRLLDQDTGVPVAGALVLLMDGEGRDLSGYLSNPDGLFLLKAPRPGRFDVRAERIGYATVRSGWIPVTGSDTVDLELQMEPAPIHLTALEVSAEPVCRIRPEDGLGVSQVWEEARKALEVQEWTEREGLHRFGVALFESILDSDGDVVTTEKRVEDALFERVPFRSLPVEELQGKGYVRQTNPPETEYYAPDATVLLSDGFLDTHCLSLSESSESPGLIGVSFRPASRPRETDIEGVLWVDRESSELRFLEFRYTPNPWSRRPLTGGRVDFARLASGAWIVTRWSIRMPAPVGYTETGAEITRIDPGSGDRR